MRVGYPTQCTQIGENAKKGLEFLNAVTSKDAKKYMGGWAAVAGGGTAARGEYPEQVCKERRKAGKGAPHMRYLCKARGGAVARRRLAL